MLGQHDVETNSRLMAKLLRELLTQMPFATLADLTDALKQRCATLKIPCTPDDFNEAYRVVGSNRSLLEAGRVTPIRALDIPATALSRRDAHRIWLALLRRHQAAPVGEPQWPTDDAPDITRRLSALPEAAALAWFWLMVGHLADRLVLLRQLGHVTIARPAGWSPDTVRHQHDLQECFVDDQCFACAAGRPLYRHHVIEVQHGGSNVPRNQVVLCFPCHKYLHPWLTHASGDRRRRDFESLASIAERCKP